MSPEHFTVQAVGLFPQQLDRLVRTAVQRGLRPLMIETLQEIMENLQLRPREWGDPYQNYPSLHSVGYGKTIRRSQIRVSYSVHETQSLVWISSLRALDRSPFA